MGQYNVTATKFVEPVTISSVTYTVTSYTDNGVQGNVINLSHTSGNYKSFVGKDGPRTATMTIEAASSTEAIPPQWATFTYPSTGSVSWVITSVSEARTATSAANYNLSLQAATGSAA